MISIAIASLIISSIVYVALFFYSKFPWVKVVCILGMAANTQWTKFIFNLPGADYDSALAFICGVLVLQSIFIVRRSRLGRMLIMHKISLLYASSILLAFFILDPNALKSAILLLLLTTVHVAALFQMKLFCDRRVYNNILATQ